MLEIKEVKTDKDLDEFCRLVYSIYENNDYFVYPIYDDYKNSLKGVNNRLISCPHKLFLASKDNKIVGRILAYVDEELNEYHKSSVGYVSQYECIEDEEVSKALLDACSKFFKSLNIKTMRGPVSLPDGDDNRGFLINAFDKYPSVMNVYNKKYYNDQFVNYGFSLYHDVFAYKAKKDDLLAKIDKLSRLLPHCLLYTSDAADDHNSV